MIKETVSAAWACADKLGKAKPIILAVTVLTSLNNADLTEIGFEKNTNELVLHLAKVAQCCGRIRCSCFGAGYRRCCGLILAINLSS